MGSPFQERLELAEKATCQAFLHEEGRCPKGAPSCCDNGCSRELKKRSIQLNRRQGDKAPAACCFRGENRGPSLYRTFCFLESSVKMQTKKHGYKKRTPQSEVRVLSAAARRGRSGDMGFIPTKKRISFRLVQKGDIVITQDYVLAAMCLARQAIPISQDGMIYNDSNIDALLLQRYTAKKIRMSGGRLKGNPKRIKEQDIAFENKLRELLS